MSYDQPALSILVATDLSDGAVAALRSGVALAKATGAALHVVHAHEISFPRSDRGTDLIAVQRETHEKRAALNALIELEMPADFAPTSVRVVEGPAAEVILRETQAVKADLIVLGTHAPHRLADRLIGSTAERVLRASPVPCLVANGPLQLPVTRAVVPSDLTAASKRGLSAAFEWVARFSPAAGATISLAHVLAPTTEAVAAATVVQIETALRDAATRAASGGPDTMRAEVAVLHGPDAAFTLLDHARDQGAQLIVMGTNSAAVLTRAVLGSVSSALIRKSDLPILLVPSPAPAPGEIVRDELLAAEAAAKL